MKLFNQMHFSGVDPMIDKCIISKNIYSKYDNYTNVNSVFKVNFS